MCEGCWTPWVGFDGSGSFAPLDSWSTPYYKVPGLDNGEWFWSLYAVTISLEKLGGSIKLITQIIRYY
jgi:hypothetical protein